MNCPYTGKKLVRKAARPAKGTKGGVRRATGKRQARDTKRTTTASPAGDYENFYRKVGWRKGGTAQKKRNEGRLAEL